MSLFAFALAVILWSTTSFNAAFVALAVVVLLVLTGGVPQEKLYESLASDVVWLMIGAFILGSAVQQTGLAARFAALVPAILYLATSLKLNPTAVLFISTVGMDYCLTFPVSSKALLMFQELDGETYKGADLLRLSSVMLLVHLALILIFYYGYWRWLGLEL